MSEPQKMTPTVTNDPVQEMAERLARMEKFITRRFDEVSAEIHATCQMLDMGVLGAITFRGDGSTPHNVGMELDAVVKTTEDAANRILDAAEEISELTKTDGWDTPDLRINKFKRIKTLTDDILTACAFQDLTGQRIGKTLENIRKAETELSDMLKKMGMDIDVLDSPTHTNASPPIIAATQDDVDALFK
jgi:chemotaxis protein CheZ